MKKVIIVLLLILIKYQALAGHVGFSSDENLLIYIPASIILIMWIVNVIHSNFTKHKEQISSAKYDPEIEGTIVKEQTKPISEIPDFFKEKDVFGLDKPTFTNNSVEDV